jgi:hypothetical protein
VFSQVFQTYVASVQLFRSYVAKVSSSWCKSRSSVAHIVVGPICNSRLLQLLGTACMCVGVEGARARNRADADRDGAVRDMERARDTVRSGHGAAWAPT